MNLLEFNEAMGKDLVFADKAIEAIYYGWLNKRNVLLWGPPGHAKSMIAERAAKVLYGTEHTFKAQFGLGTNEEDLLGALDIKRFMEEYVREYDYSKGFLAPDVKVCIFEELFDAPKRVVQMLKDILMAKEWCAQGTVCYKGSYDFVIACTNVDVNAWADGDDTLKAVGDRFPYKVKVEWPLYNQQAYETYFEKAKGVKNSYSELLAFCLGQLGESEFVVSPRTAGYMLTQMAHDWAGLEYLCDSAEQWGRIKNAAAFAHDSLKCDKWLQNAKTEWGRFSATPAASKDNETLQKYLAAFKGLVSDVQGMRIPSAYQKVSEMGVIKAHLHAGVKDIEQALLSRIHPPAP